jgi:hypothetical protein
MSYYDDGYNYGFSPDFYNADYFDDDDDDFEEDDEFDY